MRELAELAFYYHGWWIWFWAYGQEFCITHIPEDGVCSVRVEHCETARSHQMVSTVMELAEYVRQYCPNAPESGLMILDEFKRCVKVAVDYKEML